MIYLIDGYNILFSLSDSSKPLKNQRQDLIQYLQECFITLKLKGILVFDGAHRRDEESGRSYKSPLEIMYTPKGQNADSFLIEQIRLSKNPKECTLITNDAGLKRHAKALSASVQKTKDFILFLEKASKQKDREKPDRETAKNIERLLKLFEKNPPNI